MRFIIYTVTLLLAMHNAYGQVNIPCATDLVNQELLKNNPGMRDQLNQYNNGFLDYMKTVDLNQFKRKPGIGKAANSKYIIPVVFHILHNNGYFGEYYQLSDVIQEVANMNMNYSANNPYRSRIRTMFKDVEGDPQIEFRLAKIDPNGNPTTGVDYVYVGPMTDKAGDSQKKGSSWDPTHYMNIWLCANIASGGGFHAGGYAYIPGGIPSAKYDGLLVANKSGVNPAGASNDPFAFASCSHEAGHYLGLLHPFNGSSSSDSCGEDYCFDTPPVFYTPYNGTPNNNHVADCVNDVYSAPSSCASPYLPDQWENIMDYYSGPCAAIMFSVQQVARMHFTLENYRPTLWTASNLVYTGVIDSVSSVQTTPIAEFSIQNNQNLTDLRACAGTVINFYNNTYNYNSNNGTLTYLWNFGDGSSPATSTAATPPQVTYSTSGYKTITLTVTDKNGKTNTKTASNYIYVEGANDMKSITGGKVLFADWDYQNDFIAQGWHFENELPGNYWQRVTNVFYSGNACLEIPNYYNSTQFNYSLISPPFDFTNATNRFIQLNYAFAANYGSNSTNTASQDALSISISTDCGKTWSASKLTIGGNAYFNNGIPVPFSSGAVKDPNPLSTTSGNSSVNNSSNFIPSDSTHWGKMVVSGSNIPAQSYVKFKITFSAAGGNNFYLDNLMVGTTNTGINDVIASDFKLNVNPNPFSSVSNINYFMPISAKVDVKLFDIAGKEIGTIFSSSQEMGNQQLVIDRNALNLNNGLYFVKLTFDGTTEITKKILID